MPDEGKAKEVLAAEAQNELSSNGTQAAVLDSLASCLVNMGNSLQVLTLGVVCLQLVLCKLEKEWVPLDRENRWDGGGYQEPLYTRARGSDHEIHCEGP